MPPSPTSSHSLYSDSCYYGKEKAKLLLDLQRQLLLLRRRISIAARRTDAKAAAAKTHLIAVRQDSLEESVPGQECETVNGCHWEVSRLYESHRRHGSMELTRLQMLPSDLLNEITQGEAQEAPPEAWAFLDTETTGLAGGSGTCAFLVGIGRITADGFHIRQFFMRDYLEESSQLHAVAQALEDVKVLITYNGKTFDLPLLEARYRMNRARFPFTMPHLDLLHGARRLWRLRFESCKLTDLESRILGHEREDDIPGELIPPVYFDYLRSGRASRLAPVFLHNALDIVTLACLTGIVPWAFRDPAEPQLRHGAEFVALGRWLRQTGRIQEARNLFRRAIRHNLAEDILFRTMWDLASLERKLLDTEAALAMYEDLASCANAHRVEALVELAKHYEHRAKDPSRALSYIERALSYQESDELHHRWNRLRKNSSA